jgi:hypothetical protein
MAQTIIKLKLSVAIPSVLLALAFAGMLSCTISWFLLMGRIISAPPKPTLERTVPYNRHGQTVFITQSDDDLRLWLPVGGTVFGTAIFGFALWARIAWARAQAQEPK